MGEMELQFTEKKTESGAGPGRETVQFPAGSTIPADFLGCCMQ